MTDAKPSSGVQLPFDKDGKRSTTQVNQGAFEAAVRAVSPQMADEVKGVKNWRRGYTKHLTKQVELAVYSKKNALAIANGGLEYLHKTMVFERDGVDMPLSEAMKKFTRESFETGFIQGTGAKGPKPYTVPYLDKELSKHQLNEQIDKWVRVGTIEADCGEALQNCIRNEEWTDLSDFTFVLFGAGSAMGPYPLLMAMGANVIALDLDRPKIWERLFQIAKESPGTLTFPLKKKCTAEAEMMENAGCDFIKLAPEVRNWLVALKPREKFICGAYAYLDGPMFLRVSMAMDAIIQDLAAKRSVKIGVAYLCTPTDAHPIPYAAQQHSVENNKKSPVWMLLLKQVLAIAVPKRALVKNARKPVINEAGEEVYVNDSTVSDQGPNYILAKRLQHWRAVVSKDAGHFVSTNVAPATSTASVVSNKMFALAYAGFKRFKPMEVMRQETSNAVMAGLLVNDLKNPLSVAQPERKLKNPMDIFSENSFHGGCWRCGWKYDSIGWTSGLSVVWNDYLVKAYLIMYNIAQFCGWSTVFVIYALHMQGVLSGAEPAKAEKGAKALTLYDKVKYPLGIFQWGMWLEAVHALLGLTRSGWFTAALQIFSRVALVTILDYNDATKSSPEWCYLMLFAWGVTEMVRYSFFTLSLLNVKFYPLLWARYTFFIILYPMGVVGELGNIYVSYSKLIKYKGGDPILKVTSMSQHLGGYGFIVFLYALGLPFLYLHLLMMRGPQLKKAAGGSGKKVKKA